MLPESRNQCPGNSWLPCSSACLSVFQTALQIEHPITKQTHRVWFENPQIGRPLKEDVAAGADRRLFPRDCREGVRPLCTRQGCWEEELSLHLP